MISREARESGTRVGFEIQDIATQKRGWLAHINQQTGPRVGKYHVNLEDLEAIGANAINKAIESFDMIAIDEIGPMELFSIKFKNAVKRAMESSKIIVAVVHWNANDRLVQEVKAREDTELFTITTENRNELPQQIAQRISKN